MTPEQQIAKITELINKYDIAVGISKDEFYSKFEEQSLIDIKEEMWELGCFMLGVVNIINMSKGEKHADIKRCKDESN